ncbi:MAG: hypothetical protein AB7S38_17700 [Vulcanimicrobiota bacterium]
MRLELASRRLALTTIEARYPGAMVLDLTSRGPDPWVRFSPFFPHGNIPVPDGSGRLAASVEGIWQGLKVFESAGVDESKFEVESMRGLKRTLRRLGPCRAHLVNGRLLGYREARYALYLPAYRWVLDHRLAPELAELARLAAAGPVVLLDYESNADPGDLRRPLSHAGLVIRYLTGDWPESTSARK